jgi:hypothetical protein
MNRKGRVAPKHSSIMETGSLMHMNKKNADGKVSKKLEKASLKV